MDRMRAWLSQLPLEDRMAAGLAALVVVLFAFSDYSDLIEDPRPIDAVAIAMLATASGAVLLRKRFPASVVLLTMGITTVWYASGYGSQVINAPALVALFHLGTLSDRRKEIVAGGLALTMPPLLVMVFFTDLRAADAIDAVGWPLAAILLGKFVQGRRLLLMQYAEKVAAAEAERDAAAERRVADERLRIARDIHDVLAHAVAVMTVQAGVASDAQGRDSKVVCDALNAIRTAGKEAMAELRSTVALLRNGDGSGATPAAPAPRLDRLPELVESAQAQGLEVELQMNPAEASQPNGLESLVQLTAYRVVQEALTNVLRHAQATQAIVRVERQPRCLRVIVSDDGRALLAGGLSLAPAGFGLRGMRERVEALGGKVTYGPRQDKGWEVAAALPVKADQP